MLGKVGTVQKASLNISHQVHKPLLGLAFCKQPACGRGARLKERGWTNKTCEGTEQMECVNCAIAAPLILPSYAEWMRLMLFKRNDFMSLPSNFLA